MGEQLAEFRFEPRGATITTAGQASSFPFYRATFRLLNVVFDVIGYVADADMLHIEVSDDLGRALLPLWPSAYPQIWWPPVTSLDVIGGVPGLTASAIDGVPVFVPGQ